MARDKVVPFRRTHRYRVRPDGQGSRARPYRGRRARGSTFQTVGGGLLGLALILTLELGTPNLGALLSTFEPIEIGPFHLGQTSAEVPGDRWETVHHVHDGDTFTLVSSAGDRGERVRIVGIDTAELDDARCEAEEVLAMRQRDQLSAMIGDRVRLRVTGTDRYGRLLARVYNAAGEDVAKRMVAEAGARRYGGGWRPGWCG